MCLLCRTTFFRNFPTDIIQSDSEFASDPLDLLKEFFQSLDSEINGTYGLAFYELSAGERVEIVARINLERRESGAHEYSFADMQSNGIKRIDYGINRLWYSMYSVLFIVEYLNAYLGDYDFHLKRFIGNSHVIIY